MTASGGFTPIEEAPVFGFIGGDPCVDFVNTSDHWPVPAKGDQLRTYADLLAWLVQAGLIDAETHGILGHAARAQPEEAQRVLERARTFRAQLRSVLVAASSGERAEGRTVAALSVAVRKAQTHSELLPADRHFVWALDPAHRSRLDWPIWRLSHAAASLLTSESLHHVRECADAGCQWMFLDRSRNHSRRWCDMAVCGNRAKARRNYARRKAKQEPSSD